MISVTVNKSIVRAVLSGVNKNRCPKRTTHPSLSISIPISEAALRELITTLLWCRLPDFPVPSPFAIHGVSTDGWRIR